MPKVTKRKKELSEEHRDKIKVGVILNRLQNHILGKVKMTPTQVQAANILLKKVIPDLKAIEHSGNLAVQVTQITEELIAP